MRQLASAGKAVVSVQESIGRWAAFTFLTVRYLPITVRSYWGQTKKVMTTMAWGRGSIIVDGGVIPLLVILGLAVGVMIGIEAYSTLSLLGFGPLTGVVSSVFNIREIAPIMTGVGFAAQAGCRMTAEIGSMRLAEEIDATEALGIRTIPFVVGTRFLGGMLCVIPGYLLSLAVGFVTSALYVKVFVGAPAGTYDHYFSQFLEPGEVFFSLVKAVVFCAAVTIIHCFYGFFSTGGPEGVGQASGRAIRASLVMIVVLNFGLTLVLWGLHADLVFKG
jgi:phospholipid/cholesterol/gamma-HCH transport system permease protein